GHDARPRAPSPPSAGAVRPPRPPWGEGDTPARLPDALPRTRAEDDERARIAAVLEETHWNHGETAKRLGMHRTTLYRKRLRYGL
ncbi:hypothetical protein L6R52_44155, partial [Myxococcota bacterium]|nr:hypothetical protein [Myxococcota bacterium]